MGQHSPRRLAGGLGSLGPPRRGDVDRAAGKQATPAWGWQDGGGKGGCGKGAQSPRPAGWVSVGRPGG